MLDILVCLVCYPVNKNSIKVLQTCTENVDKDVGPKLGFTKNTP